MVICVRRTSVEPPRSPRKWRQFRRSQPPHESGDSSADRSPPGAARSHGGPRGTPLRWTSQETTTV
eukprot:3927866-Pyramimonas_sp.AAC.1